MDILLVEVATARKQHTTIMLQGVLVVGQRRLNCLRRQGGLKIRQPDPAIDKLITGS